MAEFNEHSSEWRAVKDWAEHQLELAERQLKAPGTDPIDTELFRGQIQILEALLKLPESGNIGPS